MLTVYIDMDGVLCDFNKAHSEKIKSKPQNLYPQSEYGFFENLEPLPDAINRVNMLRNYGSFDIFIATAPSIKNPLCYTEKRNWIEKYFGTDFLKKMIIIPDKSKLSGDYLIDDRTKGNGQDLFQGHHILFGSKVFPDWMHVYNFLIDEADLQNTKK